MKYDVSVRVWGYVTATVEAESDEEAKRLAAEAVSEMDFGTLRDIEWEPTHSGKSAEPDDTYTIEILWARVYDDHTGVVHKEIISGDDLCELKSRIVPVVRESMKKQGYSVAGRVFVEATTELNSVWLERDEAEVVFNEDGTYTISHD